MVSPHLRPPHLYPTTCSSSFQSCAKIPDRIRRFPAPETSSGSPLSPDHSGFSRRHKRPSMTWPDPFSPASSLYAPLFLVPHTQGIPKSVGSPILSCLHALKMARLLPGMPLSSLVARNPFCLQNSTLDVSFSRQALELFCDCPFHTAVQVSACLQEDRNPSSVLGLLGLNE